MKVIIQRPLAAFFFLVFVAVPVLLLVLIYVKYSRDLPRANQISIWQFEQHSLTVYRDEYSIPNIQGPNELSVYYGLGAMHAQDRLWQMEVNRRRASGTLSAVMGAATLGSDKLMRTLGLKRNAARMWQSLPEAQKKLLEAYTLGINQTTAKLDTLPIEFSIFNFTPDTWKPEDSMLLMQLMTWDLASNMESEFTRSLLIKNFGLEKANELMNKVDLPKLKNQIAAIIEPSLEAHFFNRDATGSNGWVVAGQHTLSGMPLLANDLHLPNSIPSIWYLAKLKGGSLQVTGSTFPGLPFVVVGRNQYIAWGITNMMADTQDIYFERVNPNNRNQYYFEGNWNDMEVVEERIEVKEEFNKPKIEPVQLLVRRTRNGAMLSDLNSKIDGVSFSLKWTADIQNGGTFTSFNKLNHAKNWQEFKQSMQDYVAPVQCFLYADVEGNIGYLVPGKIPKRDKYDGMLPKEGWLKENQWSDWIEFNALPQILNPKEGLIIAANNNFIDAKYPYFITGDWSADFRARTIRRGLVNALKTSNNALNVETMKALQRDISSPKAKENIILLINKLNSHNKASEVVEELTNWDGKMSQHSVAATIYTAWLYHINRLMLEDDLGYAQLPQNEKQYLMHLIDKLNLSLVSNTLANASSQWCDFNGTEQVETCDVIINSAFTHAIHDLSTEYGNNPEHWSWGDVHQAQYPYFPFSKPEESIENFSFLNGILSNFFHRKIGASGGEQTINVSPSSFRNESKFMPFYGTSYRQIIDFGDHTRDVFSIATGQSGNVFSQHYDDLLIGHINGEYIPMTTLNELSH